MQYLKAEYWSIANDVENIMTCKRHRQPLYDQLVDILIDKIDHEYQPGDLISSERELAERYGLCENKVAVRLLPID